MSTIVSTSCCPEQKISAKATQQVFPIIEPWIPSELDQVLDERDRGDWHFNFLTPSRMLRLELLQACRPQQSFQETLREIWQAWSVLESVNAPMPSSSALAQARARLPLFAFEYLFKHIAQKAADLSAHPLCPEHRVLTIDGVSLLLPRTPSHLSEFGTTRNQCGTVYFPQANAVWIAQLPGKGVLAEHLGPAKESDSPVGVSLLPKILKAGDLVLGDAHFAGYPTQTVIRQAKAFYFVRASGSFIPEKHRHSWHSANELEVEIEPSHYSRTDYKHLELPPFLKVRALHFTIPALNEYNGTTTGLFLTNLPRDTFPAQRLNSIVGLRWNQETIHNDIKTRMGLGEIRNKTPSGARREILAHLCCSNILRIILNESCGDNLADASFTVALSALRQANQQLRHCPARQDKIISVLSEMIREQRLDLRPGRSEPRLIRPHKRKFDSFTTPRSRWHAGRKAG